ncbi:Shikimate dehydrogenase [Syntrophobotulus glycolicus DSM 8271]|uniref:Shikimate dehydrogenase (NADP(+)) n=2 Tax=Syntrophobotulus TaxID=51196 RepID=F0T0U1_SYNGF|nr:Shikimate dehydrogenase [Syntrophobotulus glycolicus DSM 8271]
MRYAVIGNPVKHSLSPVMHMAGFLASGIDASYEAITVPSGELDAYVQMLSEQYHGWNITYPYKEDMIKYLDDVSEEAQALGAVNTVKNERGKLYGYNTDGAGFVAAVQNAGFVPAGNRVAVIGAGGAARAVIYALAKEEAEITIVNRNQQKAGELARQIENKFGRPVNCVPFDKGEWMLSSGLIIQGTPIGMQDEPFPLVLEGIKEKVLAVDLIYKPLQTNFLKQAQNLGCRIMNGLEMLLYQGAYAWDIWFGRKAPVENMRKALYSALEKES